MTSIPPVFPHHDEIGKRSIPGMHEVASERRLRKFTHGRVNYFHKVKNGVYDPITYFHVVATLLEIVPGQEFWTRDLVMLLRNTRPLLIWDANTVGRVLADVTDNLNETYKPKPIEHAARWNGEMYFTQSNLQSRLALVRLLEDLIPVVEAWMEAEGKGQPPKRTRSPLLDCPSVMTEGEK